jgi:soluble lytic murein transglycosylase-like protein
MDPLRDIQGRSAPGKPLDGPERQRLQKAAREFEAVFVAYMFKTMRGGVQKSGLLGEGYGGDMMDSLLDMELGRQMSRTSSFGLAEMLWRKVTGEPFPKHEGAARNASARPAAVPAASKAFPPAESRAAVQSAASKTSAAAAPASVVPATPGPTGQPTSPVITAAPADRPLRFVTGHAVAERVNTYAPLIREASEKHGVDENLIKAVIATESAGNPSARSSADAKGLMQLIDSTARSMGVRNSWSPRENILGGAKYLQQMLSRFEGNVEQALASYNAGPGAVEKYGGIPPFRETREYVGRVMEYLKIFGHDGETEDGED